jgi:hypothetical protein
MNSMRSTFGEILNTKDAKDSQRTQSQATACNIFAFFAKNLCALCG